MTLPPLYKFMGVDGAKATLCTRSFRHAKPCTFNDAEDVTIQSLFPEELAVALKSTAEALPGVLVSHIDNEPTCSPYRAAQIKELQAALRADQSLAEKFQEVVKNGLVGIGDSTAMLALAADIVIDINKHFQTYRVFCVTTHLANEKMWLNYAEAHHGIALRVAPNIEKDSHLRRFKKVDYQEKRPPLYADATTFATTCFFGDQLKRHSEMSDRIIYTKTLQWQDEAEYRVAAPVGVDDEPWDAGFYPDEIPELYLGMSMKVRDLADIMRLARRANPDIQIFQAERKDDGSIAFGRV